MGHRAIALDRICRYGNYCRPASSLQTPDLKEAGAMFMNVFWQELCSLDWRQWIRRLDPEPVLPAISRTLYREDFADLQVLPGQPVVRQLIPLLRQKLVHCQASLPTCFVIPSLDTLAGQLQVDKADLHRALTALKVDGYVVDYQGDACPISLFHSYSARYGQL